MSEPWYRRARRWSQTNLTEIDGRDCDLTVWRRFWEEHRIEGVVVNAGGIVAYYLSEDPLQYRSPYLGERDLLGEFTAAAREAGLAVIARMDSNRAEQAMYEAHPDWFAVDAQGRPYRAGERYIVCVNGRYDQEYLPQRLREIARRYAPDGFADNSWQGPTAGQICYCEACRSKFLQACGRPLPAAADWNDETYRVWVRWSIGCRMANWDLYNRVTREFDPDCLWLGMVNADPVSAHCALYDLRELGRRSPILMVDQQSRDAVNGFEQNLCNGLLLHGVCGGETNLPESMAAYARGRYTFRRSATTPLEMQLWLLCGIAGGLSPWLHVVGAVQEDRRQLSLSGELMAWDDRQRRFLEHRTPMANIGLVWSQQNVVFYGRDRQNERCALPWRGFTRALTRARIPYVPVCAEDIPTDAATLRVLVFPDVAVLTDAQLERIGLYLKAGGSVLVTGATGLLDEWGEPRGDHAMDELLGVTRGKALPQKPHTEAWDHFDSHTYMRVEAPDHPVMKPFAQTALIPFGGWRHPVSACGVALKTLATFVPPFPIYPPEFSYMRESHTAEALLLAGENEFGGRVAVLAADVDRRYGEAALPDHGDLLASLTRWLAGDELPLTVEGTGYLAVAPYRQGERVLIHLVNLSGANLWPGFAEECCPVGPVTLRLHLPGKMAWRARALVGGDALEMARDGDTVTVLVPNLLLHELIVLEP